MSRITFHVSRFTTSLRQPGPHLVALLLWTAFCGLFYASLLLGRARLPSSDFTGQFHAFGLFQAQEMAQGRLPVWSPGSYGGFPFAADTQAATFYLPRWLTILFSLPWQFPLYALELEAIGHVWLAGLFTYGLAHHITRQPAAALLAAVAFGLGGYLTSYPILQLAVLETITWLPLALWLLRRAAAATAPLPWLVAAGLALALAALAGHPQTFLHIAYLSAAYFLFLALGKRWPWRWLLAGGVLVAAVAIGVAAVSWLPAARLALHTTRSNVGYDFVAGGLPLVNYLQLVLPGPFAFWMPEYVGLASLALALMALWSKPEAGKERAEIHFWAWAALVLAWLALGDRGVLFQLAYHVAPGFSLFRQQERLLGLFSLSLALLAAQGLALWLRGYRPPLKPVMITLAAGLLLAPIILSAGPQLATRPWLLIWLRQLGVAAVTLFLLFAPITSSRSGVFSSLRPRALFLILLLAADLYLATYPGRNEQPGSPAVYWPQPAWLDQLQVDLAERPLARIDSRNLFHANLGAVYGLEDIHGISPLQLRTAAHIEKLPPARRWQLLGVAYVVEDSPPDAPLTLVAAVSENVLPDRPAIQAGLYRFDNPLPRAWMSYQPIIVDSPEAARQQLADPAFDPASQVILHPPLPDLSPLSLLGRGVGGEGVPPLTEPLVTTRRLHPAALQIEVSTAAPGLLVVSEWHYPGWQASLDGERVSLFPADYAFQGILVPAGQHTVTLRFLPYDVIAGGLISLLVLSAALLIAHLARRLEISDWRLVKSPISNLQSPNPLIPALSSFTLHASRSTLYALLLFAFGLRVFHLGVQELRGDEAYSYPFTQIALADVLPTLAPVGEEHAPVHYLLLNGWTRLAGDSEFAMRYLAVVPGLLLLPLLFQLGRHLHGRKFGFLVAGLAAVSPSAVWLSQDVRNQYVMAMSFTTLATLLLVRAVARPSLFRWLFYALACSLTMYSHYYGVFALLAHSLYLLAVPAHRRHLRAWLAAGLVAAATFAPWLLATFSGWVGQLDEPGNPELAQYLVIVGKELVVGQSFSNSAGRWLFIGTLVLCLIGGRALWRSRPAWAAMLIGWLAGATLVIYLVWLRRSIFNSYYIAPAAPAWWLLVGFGLVSLWRERRWQRSLAVAALAVLVGAAGISLFNYYRDPLRFGRSAGYRAAAEHVMAQTQPGDLFVAHFPDPSLNYYLRHAQIAQTLQPATERQAAAETEQALSELAADYDRLWFIPYHQSTWDPEEVAYRWLEYHSLVEERRTFGKLTLVAYRPLHAVDEVLKPVDEALPGRLRLVGGYITVDGRPADLGQPVVIEPGTTIDVTLVWEGVAVIPDDYTVFVHLLSADGRLLAQHDGVPAGGTRPTTSWQPGERLLDVHSLVAPAEGGTLVVGMYNSESVERQVFGSGRDAIPLAEIVANTP